jgi:hypothetical protein
MSTREEASNFFKISPFSNQHFSILVDLLDKVNSMRVRDKSQQHNSIEGE